MKVLKHITWLVIAMVLLAVSAFATGDPNIDGGGGGTGDGDVGGGNYWNVGDDGVRVTIVYENDNTFETGKSIDFSNNAQSDKTMHFGTKNKIYYRYNNVALKLDRYCSVQPDSPLPPIVTASGGANIAAVKQYFAMEGTLKDIASQTGYDYEQLVSGDYVIMLEPIIYCTFDGVKIAMTATEAALYDRAVDGKLKAKLGNATHQNLPLAMFLEKPDLGFRAWEGPRSGIRSDGEIIKSLGIGTVRFREGVPPPPPTDPPGVKRYTYHTDTDVVTAIKVRSTSSDGIDPDAHAEVIFNIGGKQHHKRFVTPPNEETLVWVKWHTPENPAEMTIDVTSSHGFVLTPTVICKVEELVEATPPDPQGRDLKPSNYCVPRTPQNDGIRSAQWGEWNPYYVEHWVWEADDEWVDDGCDSGCPPDCSGGHGHWEDNGDWIDKGWWEYDWVERTATLSLEAEVLPAKEVPTEKWHYGYGKWEIKSGYGVNINVEARVETNGRESDITCAQNTIAEFPEFDYKDYFRILQCTPDGLYSSFALRFNKYSYKGASVHYTPLWFPDKSTFEPKVTAFDVWTPAGELHYSDTDFVAIDGDCYDDWNVVPMA